jgi:hypothetical protein
VKEREERKEIKKVWKKERKGKGRDIEHIEGVLV